VTDKQGTNAYGLIKAAETLGFRTKGVRGNKEAFYSAAFSEVLSEHLSFSGRH